jgi:hypothetical protein
MYKLWAKENMLNVPDNNKPHENTNVHLELNDHAHMKWHNKF